jgi:hypothetical protein
MSPFKELTLSMGVAVDEEPRNAEERNGLTETAAHPFLAPDAGERSNDRGWCHMKILLSALA